MATQLSPANSSPSPAAMHVARIVTERNGKVYKYAYLRQTYRKNGKVKHRTLGNLSALSDNLIGIIEKSISGMASAHEIAEISVSATLPHGAVAAILGSIKNLGLDKMIYSRKTKERSRVIALIVSRILSPESKLATSLQFSPATSTSTLAESLDISNDNEDDLYESMDWLLQRQSSIEKSLAKVHLDESSLVLYDLTSTYFEGTQCPIAKRGYSRDEKRSKLQITIGLLTNREGCPISIEVFPGNMSDSGTLAAQVDKLKERFNLKNIILVGDRGMITKTKIENTLKPNGISWISCLRSESIRKLIGDAAIQSTLFDDTNIAEISSPMYPDERLIVCRNPDLADKRRHTREELLIETEKMLLKIKRSVERKRTPLSGKDNIARKLGAVENKYKMKKHFSFQIEDHSFSFKRNEESIAKEGEMDGLYVVRTNVSEEAMDKNEAVATYKSLSHVELAFRTMKTVDLEIRPIFHRKEDRVRAHAFICLLSYYVEWHMKNKLKPIMFSETATSKLERKRVDSVSPPIRSEEAKQKDASRVNKDGIEVRSWKEIITVLGTLCRVTLNLSTSQEARCTVFTQPTSFQIAVFQLLGVQIPT